MPKRTDIQSVLVIGSGPIVIGQAAEFDYSGTQACRVLRSEGLRVILVNSNPATIMTDPEIADATYVEPITPEFVEKIIARERPDALLATLGGQTALNTADLAARSGHPDRVRRRADRRERRGHPQGRGPRASSRTSSRPSGSASATASPPARSSATPWTTCWPASTTSAATPSWSAPPSPWAAPAPASRTTRTSCAASPAPGLTLSPTTEVLLEESILGWKEYELELMRDRNDNVVVVCSIENFDPMGVHTGDSITVAPAMTLTDREYQILRDVGIEVIREVGVDTGGCNIQFAVNPADGRVVVIEMNPRVSRSSALASKATGFPIAKIAARLAVGYTLDEIPNDITEQTPASFEPTLDYVVVKVPRFAFEKFPGADSTLTTTMKSVGEAMAIGRNFTEAFQKALRSLEKRARQFDFAGAPGDKHALLAQAATAHRRPDQHRDAGHPGRRHARGGLRRHEDRPLVHRPALPHQGDRRRAGRRRPAERRPARRGQAARLLRRPDRRDPRARRGRGARGAARAGRPPGLQDRRHLRRRVRGAAPRTSTPPTTRRARSPRARSPP